MSVRKDVIGNLPPNILPTVIEGLKDLDDLIQSVAAQVVLPVVNVTIFLQNIVFLWKFVIFGS